MKITRVSLVYFSPTGTTKRVAELIADQFNAQKEECDLTGCPACRAELTFGKNDLVIIGVPVYSGRVPETFRERFDCVKGDGTPAALVATYGNREYDDALLELRDLALENGFRPIGAGAVVAEHSVIRSVAAGRPDARDIEFIRAFSLKLEEKAEGIRSAEDIPEFNVSGKIPYRRYEKLPMAPVCGKDCIACGLCVKNCPAGAISADNPKKTDQSKCIGCMRCVRICPRKARELPKFKQLFGKIMLFKAQRTRKEPEMFF